MHSLVLRRGLFGLLVCRGGLVCCLGLQTSMGFRTEALLASAKDPPTFPHLLTMCPRFLCVLSIRFVNKRCAKKAGLGALGEKKGSASFVFIRENIENLLRLFFFLRILTYVKIQLCRRRHLLCSWKGWKREASGSSPLNWDGCPPPPIVVDSPGANGDPLLFQASPYLVASVVALSLGTTRKRDGVDSAMCMQRPADGSDAGCSHI